jgi:hypothetical protein
MDRLVQQQATAQRPWLDPARRVRSHLLRSTSGAPTGTATSMKPATNPRRFTDPAPRAPKIRQCSRATRHRPLPRTVLRRATPADRGGDAGRHQRLGRADLMPTASSPRTRGSSSARQELSSVMESRFCRERIRAAAATAAARGPIRPRLVWEADNYRLFPCCHLLEPDLFGPGASDHHVEVFPN